MSMPIIMAAMLLTTASPDPAATSVVSPDYLAAPTAADGRDAQASPSPVMTLDPPLSAITAEPPLPKASTATAPPVGIDRNDIIVTGRARSPGDPLEKINSKSFGATQAVDKAFVGPVALTYARVVPKPIRGGIDNFLLNLHEPDVFLNFLAQHKAGKAVETLGRFAINSTLGLAGVVDIARRRPFRLPRRPNGFADTLGYYGVKPGPFLFLPLIGASSLRDLIGNTADRFVLPLGVGRPFNQLAFSIPTGVLNALNRRAEFDEQLRALRDRTADPYAARRQLYLRTRQAEIDHLRGHPERSTAPKGS